MIKTSTICSLTLISFQILIGLGGTDHQASAQSTLFWDGQINNDINNPNNWNPNAVPNDQTRIFIGPAVSLRGSGSVLRALSMQTGSSMTFQPDPVVTSLPFSLRVTEGLNMNGSFNTFFLRGASTRRLDARFGTVSNISSGNNILIGAGADWGNMFGTFNTINVDGSNSSVSVDAGGTMTADLNFTNGSNAMIRGDLSLRNLNVSSGSRFELLNGGTFSADPTVLTRVRVDGGSMLLRGGSNMVSNGPGYQLNLLNGAVFSTSGNSHVGFATSNNSQIDLLGGVTRIDTFVSNNSAVNVSGSADLIASNRITINGGTFNYSNSDSIDVTELRLNGGTINTSQFSATDIGANVVRASGNINANIVGGTQDNINLTGTLNLGNLSSTNGFNYGGRLNIDRHHAIVLDQDIAHLGFETIMTHGGQLSSTNGIELLAGRELIATGNAQVNGTFKNQGTVNGSLVANELLEFTGNVSGEGDFTGNILLSDSFDPGNSTASVSFENLQFGESHELNLEIGGLLAGDEFDRLTVAGDLTIDGQLNIELIDGFQLGTNDVFEIIDVDGTLTGQFDGLDHGDLFGNFGGQDLFISYKYGDGNNVALVSNIAAVPEPASFLIMAFAFSFSLGNYRRRRHGHN